MRQTAPRHVHLICLLLLGALPWVAHAGITLKVQGLDDELQHAVASSVQLSQYADRSVTAAQARRLYDDAPEQARKALRPYGYYDAHVNASIDHQGKNWSVLLKVDPGEPVRVTKVDIDVGTQPAKLHQVRHAIRTFKPAKGDILNDATYTKSRDAIGAALTATGFLDARMVVHRVAVTRADHSAVVHLKWKPGRRYRFGAVTFKGSQFYPGFLKRYVPFKSGQYFNQGKLLALQQALIGSGYFAVADVNPEVQAAKDGVVPIQVTLKPNKRSVYTGGPFIGSDTGFGVQGGIKRRWVNNRGHTWDNQIVVAQRLKTLSSLYQIPLPGPNDKSLNFGAKARDADTDSSKSRTLQLVASESQLWHGWLRTIGLHALIGTFTVGQRGNEDTDKPGIEHGSSHLLYPQISLERKHGANPNFVRHGWKLTLLARSTVASVASTTDFQQVQADAKWIDAFSHRNRLILRGTVGATRVGNFHDLPPELRFFGGGAHSNRGYGYQALGPKNSYGRVIGGRNLLMVGATVEHYFVPHWGVAAFVDAGNAFNGTDINARIGAGLGLRWISPVGMIRVDLGVPVNAPDKHGLQFNLVIGPDL